MTKFTDLALDPRVLQAVTEAGYENPTPIQAGAIPEALKGRDVLGIAQTGTGKTASFTLPMITLLGQGRARARMPRSLVLCPTRELAAQVAENFDVYAKHTKLTKALLIGGVAFGEQDKLIDRGVDVLIATPGRLLDHFERGKLLLTGVQIMVVDEADRMLDMGFIPDIERIFQLTPFTRQTMFYSATMAPEIERITNTFLTAPARIEVARQATTNTNIDQKLVFFTPSRKDRTFTEKRAVLRELIRGEGESCTNGIVFCNRKMDVDVVAKSLKSHGFNAAPIHGDLDQSQRMRTLDAFRDGSLHILVASDVAARGLDIPAVSHVFNFDVPSHAEDYVHRIGRTGRAGRHGKAFTLSTPHDAKLLAGVEALIKAEIPRAEVPADLDLANAGSSRPPRERDSKSRERSGRDSRRGNRGERGERAAAEAKPEAALAVGADAPAAEPRREGRNEGRGEGRSEGRRENNRGENGRAERAERGPREGQRDSQRRERQESARGAGEQPQDQPLAERNDARSDHRHDSRAENRPEPRSDARGERNERRDRRDRRDDGPAVVGMGDHVPEFMLRSFRIDFPPVADEAGDEAPASPAAESGSASEPVRIAIKTAQPAQESNEDSNSPAETH